VWLIDWAHPEANDFAIADEVTVKVNTASARIWCRTLTASRWA
jgi:type I site-specific restriction-modification system R (restriction) subunit